MSGTPLNPGAVLAATFRVLRQGEQVRRHGLTEDALPQLGQANGAVRRTGVEIEIAQVRTALDLGVVAGEFRNDG